ncbi:MAG TPA: hypothetical protein VOA87_05450 [Thermoanaerobaculia bacterium]|nr:hypothetical protein [Thermoanaerobaculia bacterium]
MKAKFGGGNIGGVSGKGGWVEVDGSDLADGVKKSVELAKAVGVTAGTVAAIGGLAALASSTVKWENPQGTAPLAVGQVQFEYEGQVLRGKITNRSISFKCQGRTLDIACTNIIVVHTRTLGFLARHSRLRVVLTDGSELNECEFVPRTTLRFSTIAGEQAVQPRFCNRWNPLASSRGYTKLRIVGAPT